jgi:predicted enzyme involved in methoxymalonyl-ACP biosynthesis
VLKRRVEEQILDFLVARAREAGAKRLKGIYRPTPKNGLVKNHYRDLGFQPDSESAAEEQIWWLDVDAAAARNGSSLPFELI